MPPAGIGELVPTVTVTVWVPLPLSATDEVDKLQVGPALTAGEMLQLKSTVPVNDPEGATAILNFALCPALMLSEAEEPEAGPTVKSGGPCTINDRVAVFTNDPLRPRSLME